MATKAKAERHHALRRFRERFGLNLTENHYLEVINKIQSGQAKFIERQSNRVTVWELPVLGENVVICYDKIRKELITALHPEWMDQDLVRS